MVSFRYKCEACGKSYAQKVGLKIHQEQCQVVSRRGSVMTVGSTNDSESSPSVGGDEGIVDGLQMHMEMGSGAGAFIVAADDEKNLTSNENLTNFLSKFFDLF